MTHKRGPSSEALDKSPPYPAPSLLASLSPICRVASWDNFQYSCPTKISESDLKILLAAASHPSKLSWQEDAFKEGKVVGSGVFPTNPTPQTELLPMNREHMVLNRLLSECALFNNLGNRCFSKQLGFVSKSRPSEIQFEMHCQTRHTVQGQINAPLHYPQEIISQ